MLVLRNETAMRMGWQKGNLELKPFGRHLGHFPTLKVVKAHDFYRVSTWVPPLLMVKRNSLYSRKQSVFMMTHSDTSEYIVRSKPRVPELLACSPEASTGPPALLVFSEVGMNSPVGTCYSYINASIFFTLCFAFFHIIMYCPISHISVTFFWMYIIYLTSTLFIT